MRRTTAVTRSITVASVGVQLDDAVADPGRGLGRRDLGVGAPDVDPEHLRSVGHPGIVPAPELAEAPQV